MIAAIMQPYFFPYIGYFQLMHAVDIFVIYDDAQYMKHGWINRNLIAIRDEPKWITLPVAHASLQTAILQRHYLLEGNTEAIKRRLAAAYSRAPAFAEAIPLVHQLLDFRDNTVSTFNTNLLISLAHRLGLQCAFKNSSEINKDVSLDAEGKIIEICSQLGVTSYINAIGGQRLYNPRNFAARGITLKFIMSKLPPFRIGQKDKYLSIIHHLMTIGIDDTQKLLSKFELL